MNADRLAIAVRTIARFGWIRGPELSLFVYPSAQLSSDVRRTVSSRLVNALKDAGMVDAVPLYRRGEALFLSALGAEFASELCEGRALRAPAVFEARDWRHDCLAAQMIWAETRGDLSRVVTEYQLVQSEPRAMRRPDGLVNVMDYWFLVEVEHSRKSGPSLREQAKRIALATRGELTYAGRRISGAIVYYPVNLAGINHRTRLVNALNDAGIEATIGPHLQLVGFQLASAADARARLVVQRDHRLLSALQVEVGLPEPIYTGQRRGPRTEPGLD